MQELCQKWKLALSEKYNSNEIDLILKYLHNYLKKSEYYVDEFDKHSNLDQKLSQLRQGQPVQYVFNSAPFLHLDLMVDSRVLIPRPETEEWVAHLIGNLSPEGAYRILDIGTGSGCISIALKSRFPKLEITAIDISEAALQLARSNALKYGCRIQFECCDILVEDITHMGRFDCIVSNPPYLHSSEMEYIADRVRQYEPAVALYAEPDPLVFYKRIAEIARTNLAAGGWIYVEINEFRANACLQVIEEARMFRPIELFYDYTGKHRMIKARKA